MKGYPTFVNYDGYTREFAKQSVGSGWHSLIDEVFDALEKKFSMVKIIQVKEKFGGLRIYTDYLNDDFDKIIQNVSEKSFTICETCGAAGNLRDGSWYRTLCETHANGAPIITNDEKSWI